MNFVHNATRIAYNDARHAYLCAIQKEMDAEKALDEAAREQEDALRAMSEALDTEVMDRVVCLTGIDQRIAKSI
jgi:hypothetical protein